MDRSAATSSPCRIARHRSNVETVNVRGEEKVMRNTALEALDVLVGQWALTLTGA